MKYTLNAEHVSKSDLPKIRAFCKKQGVSVKTRMSKLFVGHAFIEVDGAPSTVRRFIWENVNNGAYCSIERA